MFCLASGSRLIHCALTTTAIHLVHRGYHLVWRLISQVLLYALEFGIFASLKYILTTHGLSALKGVISFLVSYQHQTHRDLVLPLVVVAPLVGITGAHWVLHEIFNPAWVLRFGRCVLYSMVNLQSAISLVSRGTVIGFQWLASSRIAPIDEWELVATAVTTEDCLTEEPGKEPGWGEVSGELQSVVPGDSREDLPNSPGEHSVLPGEPIPG